MRDLRCWAKESIGDALDFIIFFYGKLLMIFVLVLLMTPIFVIAIVFAKYLFSLFGINLT